MHKAAPVQRQALLFLFCAQALVMAPLFLHLPPWLGLVWVAALFIRWQVYQGRWRYPGNISKSLLGLACIVGLGIEYGLSFGVEPMVGLLLAAFMLKLLEARQRRDLLLIIFIGFVAVATQFLFWQNMLAAAYGLTSCIALLIAWRSCFTAVPLRLGEHLKFSTQLVLQAVPLMIVLFLVMPRLGPLWSVAPVKSSGITGFSDSMSPGDIAQLSLSSEVAFRVSFDDAEPRKSQMYWRGLVLDQFDGRRWTASDFDFALPQKRVGDNALESWGLERTGESLAYRVMLEPHQQRWLFFLETPIAMEAGFQTEFTHNYLIRADWPVNRRVQYRVTSDLAASRAVSGLNDFLRRRNLQLPESPANPRTRQLVASWDGLSALEIVDSALELYRRQFYYTLQPPPLGDHSIDEFLFITRRGFCEHFASSFVYLMRVAGVPARVVVGYQGGERSRVDDYWLIRQSSAHVWAEVWLSGQGWVRVDPTGVVAPDRIELGLSEALSADEIYLAGGENLLALQRWDWLANMRHRWDAVSYAWHQTVLGYDASSQSRLFKRLLGGEDFWRIGLALACSAGGLLGLYGLVSWYVRRPPHAAPEIRLLRRAEHRLGVRRGPSESPHQWARRVALLYPQRSQPACQVARLFETVAYAGRHDYLNKLQSAVNALPKYD